MDFNNPADSYSDRLWIQWGTNATPTGSNVFVLFPVTFPVMCAGVFGQPIGNPSALEAAHHFLTFGGSTFYTYGLSAVAGTDNGGPGNYVPLSFHWLAIGY